MTKTHLYIALVALCLPPLVQADLSQLDRDLATIAATAQTRPASPKPLFQEALAARLERQRKATMGESVTIQPPAPELPGPGIPPPPPIPTAPPVADVAPAGPEGRPAAAPKSLLEAIRAGTTLKKPSERPPQTAKPLQPKPLPRTESIPSRGEASQSGQPGQQTTVVGATTGLAAQIAGGRSGLKATLPPTTDQPGTAPEESEAEKMFARIRAQQARRQTQQPPQQPPAGTGLAPRPAVAAVATPPPPAPSTSTATSTQRMQPSGAQRSAAPAGDQPTRPLVQLRPTTPTAPKPVSPTGQSELERARAGLKKTNAAAATATKETKKE